jgi:hypothetical protein
MTAGEVVQWQRSFHVYGDADHYDGKDGTELMMRALQGKSEAGPEAWRMKFCARVSQAPIFMNFDTNVIPREPMTQWSNNLYMCSISVSLALHSNASMLRVRITHILC